METAALLKATAGWMKVLRFPPFWIGGSRTGWERRFQEGKFGLRGRGV